MNGPDVFDDHEPARATTVDEWIGRKPDNDTGELDRLRAVVAAVEKLANEWLDGVWQGEAEEFAKDIHAALEVQPMSVDATYGMCLACRSLEVKLESHGLVGTRDFSNIGESASYPVGYGCEVCS